MGELNNADPARGRRYVRWTAVFLALGLALCALVVWNLGAGSVPIPVGEICSILFRRLDGPGAPAIIWRIRLPRILMAVILGGGLSLSGFLLQTFFGNPIAGPFVLGISSGAKLAVALTLIVYLERARSASSLVLIGAAFIGAMLSTGFVLLLSRRVRNMSALLVGGIMVGYLCSAATDFLITFADDADVVNLHGWSQGSFSGMNWDNVATAAVVTGAASLGAFLLAKPIGAYQLGESYAQSLGVDTRRFRVLLILLSSVLSACVTAFAGPISFVGIAVPQLVKRALNTSKPLVVIPAVFLGGGVFCLFCDLIARIAFSPTELAISTVTSVFGAPVVILMLAGRHREGR